MSFSSSQAAAFLLIVAPTVRNGTTTTITFTIASRICTGFSKIAPFSAYASYLNCLLQTFAMLDLAQVKQTPVLTERPNVTPSNLAAMFVVDDSGIIHYFILELCNLTPLRPCYRGWRQFLEIIVKKISHIRRMIQITHKTILLLKCNKHFRINDIKSSVVTNK